MLHVAIKYAEQLRNKFHSVWFDERYKFWAGSNFFEEWQPAESTWVNHQFVSVRDGEVIGYIAYEIDRGAGDLAYGLNIINFESEPSATFAMDLGQALENIFDKFNLRKLNFYVVVGNPIEKSYDKMCEKYGGRIVGTQKQNTRLFDGKYYDEKLYEILKEDYENRKLVK